MAKITRPPTRNIGRSILFLVPAVYLAYISLISRWEIAILALFALALLYLLLRPFTVSIKSTSLLTVVYLAICGMLNFTQPMLVDSWPVFSLIILISMALQPLVFLLIVDALVGLLEGTRRVYDMAIVVVLWASTLAVGLGSTALLHGDQDQSFTIFLLFIMPWIINGFAFFVAAFIWVIARAKTRRQKAVAKKATRKKRVN